MVRVPKGENLFKTNSSLGDTASFGLDFGEVTSDRSLACVSTAFLPARKRLSRHSWRASKSDYRNRVRDTEYNNGEVRYDYLRLNCAKTIGAGFKYGAGYQELDVDERGLFSGRRVVAAANANIPTEMAMKLLKEWNARGYRLDVVWYRKYGGSTYVDPHEEDKVAFKDLPNRFPSVLSRDFRKEQDHYEDVLLPPPDEAARVSQRSSSRCPFRRAARCPGLRPNPSATTSTMRRGMVLFRSQSLYPERISTSAGADRTSARMRESRLSPITFAWVPIFFLSGGAVNKADCLACRSAPGGPSPTRGQLRRDGARFEVREVNNCRARRAGWGKIHNHQIHDKTT